METMRIVNDTPLGGIFLGDRTATAKIISRFRSAETGTSIALSSYTTATTRRRLGSDDDEKFIIMAMVG
jgi:hypothetical protein